MPQLILHLANITGGVFRCPWLRPRAERTKSMLGELCSACGDQRREVGRSYGSIHRTRFAGTESR
jgi:hypothetical protein